MVAGHYCFQPPAGRTSTALREFPLMHSGHVLDAQGNCIALPSGVCIPTDDVIDLPSDKEFLHIRFQGHIGYVRRKYVSWIRTYHGGTCRYSHLSTESWWLSTWSIQTDSVHVRCRHSNQEVDHESMGLSEDKAHSIFAAGYTYCALYFNRPYNNRMRVEVPGEHHITLAYAASMICDDCERLERGLQLICRQWQRLQPDARPSRLIRLSQCYVRDMGPSAPAARHNVADLELHDLTDWDDLGQLETPRHHPEAHLPLADWHRLWLRDRERLREAGARVPGLQALPIGGGPIPVVHLDTPCAGLGDSQDLLDLCLYLLDNIRHFPECHFRVKKTNGAMKVLPPYATPPDSLHVTQQSNWQRDL